MNDPRQPVSSDFYNQDYYHRYHQGKIFARGDKPFIYNYWIAYFRRRKPIHSRWLDIGCGEGYFCKRASVYFQTYGMDISLDAVNLAKGHSPPTRFSLGSAEGKIPYRNETFDIVISCDVLEHLQNPLSLLQEIARILKPGGWVLLSTPNPDSLGKKIQQAHWFGFRDPSHCSIKSKSEWKDIISQTDLKVQRLGSDFLWDIPYAVPLPKFVQKLILVPSNMIINRLFGFLTWNKGENLWFILQKKKN